jgi:hypothetical protein
MDRPDILCWESKRYFTRCCFQGYSTVQSVCKPKFRRNVIPTSSGPKISPARNQCAKYCLSHLLRTGFSLCWFPNQKMEWYIHPKRRLTYKLQGAISEETATFVTTAVRTSVPTNSPSSTLNVFRTAERDSIQKAPSTPHSCVPVLRDGVHHVFTGQISSPSAPKGRANLDPQFCELSQQATNANN